MNNKRPLAPGFIDKLDRNLLLNKPSIWSSRIHLVLYYGLLSILVLSILSFLAPNDPRMDTQTHVWIGFVAVVSFIGLVFYTIYLLRFNVFKRFGTDGPGQRLAVFLLTFLAIGMFVLLPYVQPYVESVRASNQYTDDEILSDLNEMNLGITRLEYDSVNHQWSRDSVRIVDSIRSTDQAYNSENYQAPTAVPVTDSIDSPSIPIVRSILKKDLAKELTRADSVVKLNDTVYLFYHCPNYKPLAPYFVSTFPSEQQYTSLDIYKKVIKNFKAPDRKAEWDKIQMIINKYRVKQLEYYDYDHYVDSYESRLIKRYSLNEVDDSMQNITERIHRFDSENLPFVFRIHFYITLCLSLLLFSFRHSTVKSFFFGLLTGIVLTIITSLILAFTSGNDQHWAWIIFYFFLFFIISLFSFQLKKRTLVTGIAINLFFWLLPFIPMVFVAAYYEGRYYYEDKYDHLQRDLARAEWIGVVLLLIFLVTYIHRVYRRWYASPEE